VLPIRSRILSDSVCSGCSTAEYSIAVQLLLCSGGGISVVPEGVVCMVEVATMQAAGAAGG
jgi:hypothetical protein